VELDIAGGKTGGNRTKNRTVALTLVTALVDREPVLEEAGKQVLLERVGANRRLVVGNDACHVEEDI